MSGQNFTRGAFTAFTGLLLSTSTAYAQEIPEPLPSTPNPGGSVLAPDEADGVAPDADLEAERPATPDRRPGGVGEENPPRAEQSASPTGPMSAEDLQTWQQIATLHEQFVRSHVPGVAGQQDVSRTDPNRQRLQRLWERLAEIERQLILSGAFNEDLGIDTRVQVERDAVLRRDLDEIPDPLTSTNQGVKASQNDRDLATARALAQEDRSPPPKAVIQRETVRNADPRDPLTAEAVEDAVEERAGVEVIAAKPVETGSLWQEFMEVRRQILIAEIAAARGLAAQE